MAVRQSVLLQASASYPLKSIHAEFPRNLSHKKPIHIFLSHSHKDREFAKGIQVIFINMGWNLYIDWMDKEMPEVPNHETALRIQHKIKESDRFMFLVTQNSKESRWCPWEIGYADGVHSRDRIVMIPTEDDHGTVYGSEYLGIYERFPIGPNGEFIIHGSSPGTSVQIDSHHDFRARNS